MHMHPNFAKWDGRIFRQQMRLGTTSEPVKCDLLSLERDDYVVVGWQYGHEDNHAQSDRTLLRLISIPSPHSRRTNEWTGVVCSKLLVMPIELGDLIPFGWFNILDYTKKRITRPMLRQLAQGDIRVEELVFASQLPRLLPPGR